MLPTEATPRARSRNGLQLLQDMYIIIYAFYNINSAATCIDCPDSHILDVPVKLIK